MKKTWKRVLAAALALTVAAGLAGCGEKKDAANGDEKIKVVMWTKVSQDANEGKKEVYEKEMELIKAKFPQYEIIDIVAPTGGGISMEYDKALMAGEAPSFINALTYNEIPTRIKNGTVADITELVADWDIEKQGLRDTMFDEANTKDGRIYALTDATYLRGTYVNKQLVEKSGGDPDNLAKTWDELVDYGVKMTDFSIPRYCYSLLGSTNCSWPYVAWVWSAGGEMVRQNEDGTWRVAFNEPEAIDAAEFLHSMIWEHEITQKDVTVNPNELRTQVVNGTAAYSWNTYEGMDEKGLNNYGLSYSDFEVTTMPMKDESLEPVIMANSGVLTFNPKLSEEELKAAFEVATYRYFDEEILTAKWEIMDKHGMVETAIPGRTDLYEKKMAIFEHFPQECKDKLIGLRQYAKPEPFCPNWSEIKKDLEEPIQKLYITKDLTRDDIQKMFDDCAEVVYSKYGDAFKK